MWAGNGGSLGQTLTGARQGSQTTPIKEKVIYMRFLDMTPYTPFRSMGQSCQTRPVREKIVRWLKPEPRETPDGSFVGRPLALEDIEAAAELWRHGYPELYGSSHGRGGRTLASFPCHDIF